MKIGILFLHLTLDVTLIMYDFVAADFRIERRRSTRRLDRDSVRKEIHDQAESVGTDSCLGKCGRSQALPCSCDPRCVVYNNCCFDMEDRCPDIIERGRQLFHRQLAADVICLDSKSPRTHYFVVAGCPKFPKENTGFELVTKEPQISTALGENIQSPRGPPNGKLVLGANSNRKTLKNDHLNKPHSLWKDLNSAPVTQLSTGINYLNMSVFSCFSNNRSDAELWYVRWYMTKLDRIHTLGEFVQHRSKNINFSLFKPPNKIVYPSITHSMCISRYTIDKCNPSLYLQSGSSSESSTGNNSELLGNVAAKCNSFFSLAKVGHDYYKNKYCAMCNSAVGKIEPVVIYSSPQNSKNMFLMSANETVVSLLYEYGDLNPVLPYGSWRHAECKIPSVGDPSGQCQVLECSHGFVKRPGQVCATVHGLGVGFLGDEYPMTLHQLKNIQELLQCRLNFLDFVVEYKSEPVTFHYEFINRRVFLLPLNFYTNKNLAMSNLDPTSSLVVSKLMDVAKWFKQYRMTANQSGDIPEEKFERFASARSAIFVRKPFPYEEANLRNLLDGLGVGEVIGPRKSFATAVCVCSSHLQRVTFDCGLLCLGDDVMDEDARATSSNDECFDRFRKAMSSTGYSSLALSIDILLSSLLVSLSNG